MGGHRRWSVVLLVTLIGCAQTGPPAGDEIELEDLLPAAASLGDWTIAEGPNSYDPDTLWEHLDGGAQRYLAYGLERMVHIRYQLGDDPLASVSIEVYEMQSKLGAYGIYSTIRPPDVTVQAWGAEGYRSASDAAAWKGAIFVHASADDERPQLVDTMETLVSRICEGVTGEITRPAILDPLPHENLVPHSERYVAIDLFGHVALPGGVLATYEIEGQRGEIFFSELANEDAAQKALQAFREEKARWAEVVDTQAGFRFQDPGVDSGTVLRSGRFVVGVHGELSLDSQDDLVSRLIGRLPD